MAKPPSGRVWTCDGCRKRGTWGPGWGHYAPIPSFENAGAVLVTCSPACDERALARVCAGHRDRGEP